jgi:hypothetical protein
MMNPEAKIKLCAHGNTEAEAFMIVTYDFFHAVDDIFDRDKPISQEDFAKVAVHFMIHLAGNPFFQAHKDRLLALIEQGIAAWVDADKPGNEKVSFVLKRQYHEIFWQCARLTGGWPHMREIQNQHRHFED